MKHLFFFLASVDELLMVFLVFVFSPSGRYQELVKKTDLDGLHPHSQQMMQSLDLDPGYSLLESKGLPSPILLSRLGERQKELQWILVKCIAVKLNHYSRQCRCFLNWHWISLHLLWMSLGLLRIEISLLIWMKKVHWKGKVLESSHMII